MAESNGELLQPSTESQVPSAPAQAAPVSAPSQPAQQAASSTPSQPQQSFTQQARQVSAPAAPSFSAKDYLRSKGIDQGFADDQGAVNYLLSLASEAEKMKPWANYGQQYASNADQLREFMAQREQTQKAPAAPKYPDLWGKKPEWKAEWENQVKVDSQTGRYVGVDQYTHPQIVQAANEHYTWRRDAAAKLLENPFELTWEGNKSRLDEALAQHGQQILAQVQEVFANQQRQQFIHGTLNQHSNWLYAHDQQGNLIYDTRADGQAFPRLTDNGVKYGQAVAMVQQYGIQDPQAQHQMAMQMIAGQIAPQQQAQQTQTAPPRQQTFRQRATHTNRIANLTGTMSGMGDPNGVPQNPNLTFGQMALAEADNQGLIPR